MIFNKIIPLSDNANAQVNADPPLAVPARHPSISIIIPVLNEIGLIEHFLSQLRERASGAELIVVDGGSSDETPQAARPLCDQLLQSAPGRARQLNAGARVAHGDILWFLHADVEPPPRCLDCIQEVLSQAGGGYFRIRMPRSSPIYRLTDSFAHYAGQLLRMRCGDHGLFCRRSIFEAIGGFPELPLMEDVEFYRALRRVAKVRHTSARLTVSPRRYERLGALRITASYGLIAMLYTFGVRPAKLARLYARTCSRGA